MTTISHTPVLLNEAINALATSPGMTVVDATFGRGGHSRALLEAVGPTGVVIAIDQDEDAVAYGNEHFANAPNFSLYHANFIDLPTVLTQWQEKNNAANPLHVDAILFDLGVSSPQLESADRGFSFQMDGPLDMRMNQKLALTAADIVNRFSSEAIRSILRNYGEVPLAGKIANAIAGARRNKEIATTHTLANIIRNVLPFQDPRKKQDAVICVFQALRIAVNEELVALTNALASALQLLKPGGRLAVISFHSLEDRIVKHYFRAEAKGCTCPPEFLKCVCGKLPSMRLITKSPIRPSEDEIRQNPRARSAMLRVAERIQEG